MKKRFFKSGPGGRYKIYVIDSMRRFNTAQRPQRQRKLLRQTQKQGKWAADTTGRRRVQNWRHRPCDRRRGCVRRGCTARRGQGRHFTFALTLQGRRGYINDLRVTVAPSKEHVMAEPTRAMAAAIEFVGSKINSLDEAAAHYRISFCCAVGNGEHPGCRRFGAAAPECAGFACTTNGLGTQSLNSWALNSLPLR